MRLRCASFRRYNDLTPRSNVLNLPPSTSIGHQSPDLETPGSVRGQQNRFSNSVPLTIKLKLILKNWTKAFNTECLWHWRFLAQRRQQLVRYSADHVSKSTRHRHDKRTPHYSCRYHCNTLKKIQLRHPNFRLCALRTEPLSCHANL